MESRVEAAHERHRAGYNCAQAVACTYADLFSMSEQDVFRTTEGFGLGMGGMEGTCGALTGACFLVGLANSDGNLDHPGTKGSTYKISRQILERFHEMNGSTQCRELKGVGTDHGPLRPCPGCVEDACKLVEEILLADE
ncbi:C-GCAxxG-C-C family protein [uncultured Parolsenella sp.]|uniref:C-GCAxxG-C-C family protein n=1 Tax=uncultured Parolsenella sp. TaxID=2083008 RepID=UPI0025D90C23|nr:C-GCAxxG-C-C family protein [uncultured Parolsenella sp.]